MTGFRPPQGEEIPFPVPTSDCSPDSRNANDEQMNYLMSVGMNRGKVTLQAQSGSSTRGTKPAVDTTTHMDLTRFWGSRSSASCCKEQVSQAIMKATGFKLLRSRGVHRMKDVKRSWATKGSARRSTGQVCWSPTSGCRV